jgi:DNA-binding CsgD family transcriptional regulator
VGGVGEEQLFQLLDMVYRAATDAGAWPMMLGFLCQVTRSTAASFFHADSKAADGGFCFLHGLDMSVASQYLERHQNSDPRLQFALQHDPGWIYSDQHPAVFNRFLSSSAYREYYRPYEIPVYLMGTTLRDEPAGRAALNVNRPWRGGVYDGDEQQLFERLLTHVQRALGVHRQVSHLRVANQTMTDGFDQLAFGVVFLDRFERVLHVNRVAARVLEGDDVLQVRERRLEALGAGAAQRLERALARALVGSSLTGVRSAESIMLFRSDGRRPLAVLVAPVQSSIGPGWSVPGCAAVVFMREAELANSSLELIAASFGLTPRETQLAAGLMGGRSLEAIAEELRVARETLRTYLKGLFRKTGTRRQAELVAVLLSHPAHLLSRDPVASDLNSL